MERAYREVPQDAAEVDLDPQTWEPVRYAKKPRKKRRAR